MTGTIAEVLESFTDFVAFEQLCCDVLARVGYAGIDPQGQGRQDGGKDALLDHPKWGAVVFHFSLRKDWRRKLDEDLDRVARKGAPCDRFVFVTNRALTALDKDRAKEAIQARLAVSADIFDQARLSIAISGDKIIREQYFPGVGSEMAVESLAATLRTLVDQGLVVPASDQMLAIPVAIRAILDTIVATAFSDTPEDAVVLVTRLTRTLRKAQKGVAQALDIVACGLFQNDHRPEAEAIWELSAEVDATIYTARFNLAVAGEYDVRGRRYGSTFDVALVLTRYEAARAAATTPTEEAMCLENTGVIYMKLGDRERATELFVKAHEMDPEHPSPRFNLSAVVEPKRRRSLLRGLLGSELDSLARINLALDELGRDNEHAARLVDGIEDLPLHPEGYDTLARVALANHDILRARQFAERLLESYDDRAEAHRVLALVATAQNDTAVTIAAYETAIDLAPNDMSLALEFVHALQRLDGITTHRRAIEHLQTMKQRWPDDVHVHLLLGNACFDAMPSEAAAAYRRVLELEPTHIEAEFNLGALAEEWGSRIGDNDAGDRQAMMHYQRALGFDSKYLPALANMGTCLLRIGEAAAALRYLERAIEIEPTHPVALGNLGTAYWRLGRRDDARSCFQRLLDADPNNRYALHNLAGLSGLLIPDALPSR
jgi:tetratricopeptide (TPR) repeat protein